jgi:hypothetical protein
MKEWINFSLDEAKEYASGSIANAESLIPEEYVPNLPPIESLKDIPKWHDFEEKIWSLGEELRQLLVDFPRLRKDKDLQEGFVRISVNQNAKRGRQSFILLLGYKFCVHHANQIASQINDPFVNGHVISTLKKMQVSDFVTQVKPFLNSKFTWIRKESKKYLAKYDSN